LASPAFVFAYGNEVVAKSKGVELALIDRILTVIE